MMRFVIDNYNPTISKCASPNARNLEIERISHPFMINPKRIRIYPLGKKNPMIHGTLGIESGDPWGINGNPAWFYFISKDYRYLKFLEREMPANPLVQLQKVIFDLPNRKIIEIEDEEMVSKIKDDDFNDNTIEWSGETRIHNTLDLPDIKLFMYRRAAYVEVGTQTKIPNLMELLESSSEE